MADRVQMRAAPKMELLEILNKILITKNQIRDIVGENDNIARYSIAIHNKIAEIYNDGWRAGFHDRYYALSNIDRWLTGPIELLPYNIDAKYYDKFDTEELTDIMKDVLNYRLQMKDELNEYLNDTVYDDFKNYPTYLNSLLDRAYDLGNTAGIADADRVYEASSEVVIPTITVLDNIFALTTTQDEAILYYKLGEDGVTSIYTGQVIISEPCTVYYWAKVGKAICPEQTQEITINPNGTNAFVFPPNIYQEGDLVYITTNTKNATIHYKIDDNPWDIYYGVILVNNSMSNITAMCTRNNEYSKYNTYEISHEVDIDQYRPANVNCMFTPIEGGATITLSCSTENARIFYAIDEADGFYREYTEPVNQMSTHFILYTYATKDGYTSKMKLVYRYDEAYDPTIPEDVKFIEEGNVVTLYTTTEGAHIFYRINSIGSYIETNTNVVELTLLDKTDITAYAVKDNKSSGVTTYTFWLNNNIYDGRPPKPTILQNDNYVTIASDYTIKYTIDQSDPRIYGATYNPTVGIRLTESTVIKAVAENNGLFSDIVTKICVYNDYNIGESGSEVIEPDPTNGVETGEEFVLDNWFAVEGITSITFDGTIFYATYGDRYWTTIDSDTIEGLNPNKKYYFKGNVSRIKNFEGSATISGDISSIKGGELNNPNVIYDSLFMGCKNLVNASGITINTSNMSNKFLFGTFLGCTDLYEAAFTIEGDIPENGLYDTFGGCTNLAIGPIINTSKIGNHGMYRTFANCVNLESEYSFNLNEIDIYGMAECFYDCEAFNTISMSTPSGKASDNAFYRMFYKCNSLVDASNINLAYTEMGMNTCKCMFEKCNSLRLPFNLTATTMADSCYYGMFNGCTSLDTAPNIYAQNLAANCFNSMFMWCTSLRIAPDLEVENLIGMYGCYSNMFRNCKNLSQIKAMFINRPTGNYTSNWVLDVAESGTFIANSEASWINNTDIYGPNKIPDGWIISTVETKGKIQNMLIQDGICTIITNSTGTIYWGCYEGPVSETGYDLLNHRYDGPFEIPNWQGTISAAVLNDDNIWGPIAYKTIDNTLWPTIVATQRNGQISLASSLNAFTFDQIKYRLSDIYNHYDIKQDWTIYSGPFTITQDYWLEAIAYKWEMPIASLDQNIYYNTSSPVIEFLMTWNGTHTEILGIYCYISYPNVDILKGLWYKINDNNNDTPDTSSAWKPFTGAFKASEYLDENHTYVAVTAIAKVEHDAGDAWTSINKQICYQDSTEQLSDPVLYKFQNSNIICAEYDGISYPYWSMPDTKIEYKFWNGGAVKEYVSTFDLADSGAATSRDIDVYVRTRCGNVRTEWVMYTFYFDTSYIHFDVDTPEVYAKLDDDGKIRIYMSNTTQGTNLYRVQNYLHIEILGTDAVDVGSSATSGFYGAYKQFTQPEELKAHVTRFRLYGKSKLKDDWSDEYISKDYDIKIDFNIPWNERPAPTVTIDSNNDYKVTINTAPYSVTPLIMIYPSYWSPEVIGTAVEHKYDEYKLITNYDFGVTENNYEYAGYLDDRLGSGIMYVKYIADGIESEVQVVEYKNNNVSEAVAPEVAVRWVENNGVFNNVYVLYVTNDKNNYESLAFRMENCVWAKSVQDTAVAYKYYDPITAHNYGDALDERLYEADIIGITSYPNTNIVIESEPYHFVNEHKPTVLPPIVEFNKSKDHSSPSGYDWYIYVGPNVADVTGYWEYYVPESYWRIKPESNPQWDPRASNTNKYDGWIRYYGGYLGDALDIYLLNATFEAFSILNGVKTDTVEVEFDSGVELNDAAPSIDVTLHRNNENINQSFYAVKITNNATQETYPRFKWKLVDIEQSFIDEVTYSPSNYYYTYGQDGYIIDTGGKSTVTMDSSKKWLTFNIGMDVKSAKIICYCTDEANHSTSTQGTRTQLATYNFTNELIS